MLKTKTVEIGEQKFVIASLSVRQYSQLQDARSQLYGDATSAEDIMAKAIPLSKVIEMEANYVVLPSLDNASKQVDGVNGSGQTADKIMDELDNDTFRFLVREILTLIGVRLETAPTPGPRAVAPGENSGAAAEKPQPHLLT